MVFLGASLSSEEVESILATISDDADVLAWEHKDMVGNRPLQCPISSTYLGNELSRETEITAYSSREE